MLVGHYLAARPLMDCGGRARGWVRDADGSTFTAFDATPDSVSTQPNGINDQGDIVGWYDTIDGKTHGFVLPGNGEPAITIDFPHQTGSTRATSIDKSGKIVVGYFGDFDLTGDGSRVHPFKLTLCGAHCGQAP